VNNTIPIDPVEGADPGISAKAIGTIIHLVFNDDDIASVVEAGYKRLVIERSDNSGLTFEEITVPSERPVLDAANGVIEFYDRRGNPDGLYRSRYIGNIGGEELLSDPSESIRGSGLAIQSVLTVAQLKERYLFGVKLTDDFGRTIPDAVLEHYILSAIRWFEHTIDIPILPTAFVERHDYYMNDYEAFVFIKLDNHPVLSIEEFRVQYPSGQNVIVFPKEWLRLNAFEGQLQVVPTAGTLSEILIGQGGSFLPVIYSGMRNLPQLFEVSYTAGFAEGRVPRNLVDLIGMFASLGPFNIFGDLIAGAGIASISLSMDGLSQSIGTTSSATNAGYGARVIQYLKQIKDQIPNLRRYYHGTRLVVA